jgi:hypothetical protein
MGMSNEQFDSYKQRELRLLQKAQREVASILAGARSETLDEMIDDLKSELKKP